MAASDFKDFTKAEVASLNLGSMNFGLYEMLGEAQRDLIPEQAAQTLRDQSEIYFSERPI